MGSSSIVLNWAVGKLVGELVPGHPGLEWRLRGLGLPSATRGHCGSCPEPLGLLASVCRLGPACRLCQAGRPPCPSLQHQLAGTGLLFPADCTLRLTGAQSQGKASPELWAKLVRRMELSLGKGKFLDSKSLSTPHSLVNADAVARFRGTGHCSTTETGSK